MIRYFYGEDTWAARQALEQLVEGAGARLVWLDRDDLTVSPLHEWAGWGSGNLFGRQILVVRDASRFPRSLQEDILALFERGVPGDVVMWDRGQPDKKSPLFRQLKEHRREFAALSPGQAATWIAEQALGRRSAFQGRAARLLVDRAGCDRWRLLAELEKLLLSSDAISEAMVVAAVPLPAEAEIFSMLDALVSGHRSVALENIETLLASGYSEFYIFSMLAYQFRTMLVIRAGLDSGRRLNDIVREGGIKQFSVQKNIRHAQRFSHRYLLTALTKILAAEFAITQGKTDPKTGLMMFVLGLGNSPS